MKKDMVMLYSLFHCKLCLDCHNEQYQSIYSFRFTLNSDNLMQEEIKLYQEEIPFHKSYAYKIYCE